MKKNIDSTKPKKENFPHKTNIGMYDLDAYNKALKKYESELVMSKISKINKDKGIKVKPTLKLMLDNEGKTNYDVIDEKGVNITDTKKGKEIYSKEKNIALKEKQDFNRTNKNILGVADLTGISNWGDASLAAEDLNQMLLTPGVEFDSKAAIQDGIDIFSAMPFSGQAKTGMKITKTAFEQLLPKMTTSVLTDLVGNEINNTMTKNKKKYGYGSSGVGNNYIENPDTALYENQIANVKAEQAGANNGLVKGMKIFGNLAQMVGSQMMSQGMAEGGVKNGVGGEAGDGNGVARFLNKNYGDIQSGMGMINAFSQFKAMGGQVSGVPVEVEGQEVGETPNGELLDFQGPSHEQGGIPISLPEGTEIYSKRIKVDGVSMANRKKKREKKTMTLESLFEKNKTDTLIKNSLNRTKQNNETEENADKQIQQVVKQLLDKQENSNVLEKHLTGNTVGDPNPFASLLKILQNGGNLTDNDYGGFGNKSQPSLSTPGINPVNKKSNITGNKLYSKLKYDDVYPEVDRVANNLGIDVDFNNPESVKAYGERLGISNNDGKFGKDYYDMTKRYISPLPKMELKGVNSNPTIQLQELIGKGVSMPNNTQDNNTTENTKNKSFNDLLGGITFGDMLGMVGNYYQADKTMDAIQENRAGDTPNINAFKDYGQEGLKTLDDTKKYINQVREQKLKDLELSRTGTIKRNSNSSRSLNTTRALNLATDAGVNNAQEETYNSFAEQMMGILAQEAGMKNQIDQVVMGGEDQRDDRDRQDRDNYFTQLITGHQNKGKVMSEIGRNLNQIKTNNVGLKAVNNLANYVNTDSNGNISMKPGVTIVGTTIKENGKEVGELTPQQVFEMYKKGLLTQKGK